MEPLSPRSRGATTALVLTVVFALGLVMIGYIRNASSAAEAAREASRAAATASETLRYNAVRGECIRAVVADAEESFRRGLTAWLSLLSTSRSTTSDKAVAILDRMRREPNYADTVTEKCPPAVEK